ncbi:MAG: hypothetical protein HRU15_08370 [Planctomycetes bacterium]|nr:hypothetical protein [Planctomycetota bacterium]
MHDDDQEYQAHSDSRKPQLQRSVSSDKRPIVGGRKMSSDTNKSDYDPHSDAQLKALRSDKEVGQSSSSRVQLSHSSMTHICSPCRHIFRARARPLRGICYLILALIILLWCLGTQVTMVSAFWTVALCIASFIFVFIGSRQFYLFTSCTQCGSIDTSRLDSAHGRQIQTETHLKSETSYIRNKI